MVKATLSISECSAASPCKDCNKRSAACWDNCEDYKKFKEKIEKAKKNRKEYMTYKR